MRFLLTLVIGGLGGWFLFAIHMPLAWLLGSMAATGLAAAVGVRLSLPTRVRIGMLGAIGAALGSSFDAEFLGQAGGWLTSLVGLFVYIFTASVACVLYLRHLGGLDPMTAFFAGIPGGLVEMVELGREHGADTEAIALVHSARIFTVVLCLPFLIQQLMAADLGNRNQPYLPLSTTSLEDIGWFGFAMAAGIAGGLIIRLPAPFLLGPMLVSASLHMLDATDFSLPSIPLALAQVAVGASIGSRFAGSSRRKVFRSLGLSLGATTILLGLTLGLAAIMHSLTGAPVGALLLAYAPGGLPEMSLVALSLNLEAAFVVCHHLVRVMIVIIGAPLFFAWLRNNKEDRP